MSDILRFKPSRIDGLPEVIEVVVYSDRLEFLSAGKWIVFRFEGMGLAPRWFRRLKLLLGWKPKMVGDRDWFHAPPDRFFKFFTEPELVLYMPIDEPLEHSESNFWKVQEILGAGGFHTYDLG